MKNIYKINSFSLFTVSLIILGAYIVQAEEVEILPEEPPIEEVEVIEEPPQLVEAESELLPYEISTDLAISGTDELTNTEVIETTTSSSDLVIPANTIEVTSPLELEIIEIIEIVEDINNEDLNHQNDFFLKHVKNEVVEEHLPTKLLDCVGGRFRNYSRAFVHPGECLQYIRSL